MQRRFETAQRLLAAGRAGEAKAEFAPVARLLSQDAGARQFMGCVLMAAGDAPGACEEFRVSLANLPRRGEQAAQVGAQHGEALFAAGRLPQAEAAFRTAVAADARQPAPVAGLADLLGKSGRAAEADRLLAPWKDVAFFPIADVHAEVLGLLGRKQDELEQRRRGLALRPDDPIAWHNLAAAEGNLHRFAPAEAATGEALRRGLNLPETWLVRGRALSGLDRLDEAEAAFDRALALRPLYVEAHRDLADLIWTRTGDADAALARIDAVLARQPDLEALVALRVSLLDVAGAPERAEAAVVEAVNRPGATPWLKGLAAMTLLRSRPDLARGLAEVAAAASDQPDPQRILAEAHLAQGEPQAALAIAERLLAREPDGQGDIALAATARRLMGEPRGGLEPFERIVRGAFIDAPPGWRDLPHYLADLQAGLERLHLGRSHPVGQSLRGGTQTRQNLLESEHPAIRAFPQAIDGPIRAYLAALGRGDDPLRRRNTGGYRIAGIWSVRLWAQGHHVDHVHPAGWISSACHIALPSVVGAGGREGWLKFGEPGLVTDPPLPPEHFVRPEAGKLVLFPSYLWHGTVPFTGDEPRLTIAFDLLPD